MGPVRVRLQAGAVRPARTSQDHRDRENSTTGPVRTARTTPDAKGMPIRSARVGIGARAT